MRFIALSISSRSSAVRSLLQSARVSLNAFLESSHPSVSPFTANKAGRNRNKLCSARRSQNRSANEESNLFNSSDIFA